MASAEALRILRELQSRPDNKVRRVMGVGQQGACVLQGVGRAWGGRPQPPPLLFLPPSSSLPRIRLTPPPPPRIDHITPTRLEPPRSASTAR